MQNMNQFPFEFDNKISLDTLINAAILILTAVSFFFKKPFHSIVTV